MWLKSVSVFALSLEWLCLTLCMQLQMKRLGSSRGFVALTMGTAQNNRLLVLLLKITLSVLLECKKCKSLFSVIGCWGSKQMQRNNAEPPTLFRNGFICEVHVCVSGLTVWTILCLGSSVGPGLASVQSFLIVTAEIREAKVCSVSGIPEEWRHLDGRFWRIPPGLDPQLCRRPSCKGTQRWGSHVKPSCYPPVISWRLTALVKEVIFNYWLI